jgi:2-hydroxychromene-2-carboxylate isomerase
VLVPEPVPEESPLSTSVELFFDPGCPFCWITSRWIEEVRTRVDLAVTYRPISLRMLNPDEDPAEPMGALHHRGLELLRVCTAVAEQHGDDAVARLYTALGEALHERPLDGEVEDFADVAVQQAARPSDLRALLRGLGLPEDLAAAAEDARHDDAIRASTEVALSRAGDDVGTPIITFGPPDGPSFFGPILSELPTGDEAVRLFEATRVLAEHRPFTEFKRSLRAVPDTEALAGLR